jgi:hypothetical protein
MNNELYDTYVENIRHKITNLNNILFNTTPIDKTYSNSFNPKHHKDDTMQLNNLLWKQRTLEYRKLQKKIISNSNYKEKEYNIVSNEDELLKSIEENSYKKTWNRLDLFQKKTKIKEYILDLYTNNKLSDSLKNTMISKIDSIIKKGSSKLIIYNNINSIRTIWCIQLHNETNKYIFTI